MPSQMIDIPLNRAMNALAQMVFGMGHRLEGEPDINLFFGNSAQVRHFRTRASMLAHEQQDSAIASDFPHTMVGASTDTLLEHVVRTPESEITYYGASFLAEKNDELLHELTCSCAQLANYVPFLSSQKALLLPSRDNDTGRSPPVQKKIIMLLNKFPLSKILNDAVLAGLNLGNKVPIADQYLLNIGSADVGQYRLTNISFHSNVILKTDRVKHVGMAQCAIETVGLMSTTKLEDGAPLVTVAFGDASLVERIIPKSETRLFGDALGKKDLVPVQVDTLPKAVDCAASFFAKLVQPEALPLSAGSSTTPSGTTSLSGSS